MKQKPRGKVRKLGWGLRYELDGDVEGGTDWTRAWAIVQQEKRLKDYDLETTVIRIRITEIKREGSKRG